MERTQSEGKKRELLDLENSEKAEIKALYKNVSEAIKAKDVDKIMSNYASEVVVFDIVPPLEVVGKNEYRNSWERFLSETSTVTEHEVKELKITVSDDVAFAHGLIKMTGTMKDGEKMDCWMRITNGFRKINGQWLVTHEQISVPVDMATNKACWDLKPEWTVH
jgi:uncharacterized protein (TIGR02246 family)